MRWSSQDWWDTSGLVFAGCRFTGDLCGGDAFQSVFKPIGVSDNWRWPNSFSYFAMASSSERPRPARNLGSSHESAASGNAKCCRQYRVRMGRERVLLHWKCVFVKIFLLSIQIRTPYRKRRLVWNFVRSDDYTGTRSINVDSALLRPPKTASECSLLCHTTATRFWAMYHRDARANVWNRQPNGSAVSQRGRLEIQNRVLLRRLV